MCGTLTEVLSRTRLISSCIAVVMVGPRPAGLLAHRPASGLTVRGLLCGVGSTNIFRWGLEKIKGNHIGSRYFHKIFVGSPGILKL